ncbi:NUDIX domain-containing protein [Nocardia sp. NBC_01730]|uniref:NUDIX domain-containing protein n=1 Tax=Nocardia sp. NBC_01730 TaxID=2975998 RepID=UPI002E1538F6|nr:NUDIX domain-containing protein [Nocardia sp. NBC_01730]
MEPDTTPHYAATPRGAVAIITNGRGQLLLHLRDDLPHVTWPGYWSVLGGGCDPGENPRQAIVRELDEEAGLSVDQLSELFETRDEHGSGQLITFFAATWDGDETALPLTEGIRLQFFDREHLNMLAVPPFIRDGIHRYLTTRPA